MYVMSTTEAQPVARSAAEQGSNVPTGWKPTLSEPVPVVRCTQIKRDGERCKKWSLRGYHKCIKHAGPQALMPDGNVQKHREAVLEAARLRMLDDADECLDVLADLRQVGTAEAIRLKAATEILDRVGLRAGVDIDVHVDVTDSPTDELRKRLTGLKEGMLARQKMIDEAHADVVEGEIIEDSEQLELFDMDEEAP